MKNFLLGLAVACAGTAASCAHDAAGTTLANGGHDDGPPLASPAQTPEPQALQAEAATADATLVPHASWTCGMPQGIPPPKLGKPAFTAELDVKANTDLGQTQFGKRRLIQYGAGRFTGPALEATLTSGGFEVPLELANGAVELEDVLVLRGGRGGYIYLRVCGVAANSSDPVRVVMDFEAPNSGPYASVNRTKLVGTRTLSADGRKVSFEVYDVTNVALPAQKVEVANPAGVRDQTWECKKVTGRQGSVMYRETVGIGGSQSVGASKRGTRNIIPITGGSMTGRIAGKILPLGADFQLLGGTFHIDARYVMETSDGALIIVRNCGNVGELVPVFEASSAGKYAWINEDKWLSSNPSIGLGSVSLTIYEMR